MKTRERRPYDLSTVPSILGAPAVPATPANRPYPVAYAVARKY